MYSVTQWRGGGVGLDSPLVKISVHFLYLTQLPGTVGSLSSESEFQHVMAEKKRNLNKKLEKLSMNPKVPMSKEQKEVTHWLKENVPTKKTKFLQSHIVNYFSGSKAVDLLVTSSPWSGPEGLFSTREKCVEYLDTLLRYKMFHRAKKIAVGDKDSKKKQKKEDDDKTDTDADKETGGETGGEEAERAEKTEKKKRKIRLDMHLEQMFVDTSDAFVWLYDPIPW